jgi:hypothetical protein
MQASHLHQKYKAGKKLALVDRYPLAGWNEKPDLDL